jgi:hypothetical protein
MMAFGINDLAAQFGAMAPQDELFGPYAAEGMMPSFPMLGAGETPESAMVDPMLGVTNQFGMPATAPAQYGYNPQPRPPLPAPIAADEAGLYGPFRGIWEEMQAEPDPLAALLARPEEPLPPEPRVPELPYAPAQQFIPPSPQERMMAQRYPRAMDRVTRLRGLMANRGF